MNLVELLANEISFKNALTTIENTKMSDLEVNVITFLTVMSPSLQSIYQAGGRKFVLMNFGQFGCTPAAILRNKGVCR